MSRRGLSGTLRVVVALALLTTAVASQAAARQTDAGNQIVALIEDVNADRRLRRALPVPAGTDPRYDDRLGAVAVEGFEAELERVDAFRERLTAIDRAGLDPATAIDARLLQIQLDNRAGELRHRGYLLPIGSRYGFHFGFASEPESRRFRSVADYDRYIARLQSFGEHARQQIALMRAGIEAGMVLPAAVMQGYERTAGMHVVARTEDSGFWAPFVDVPAAIEGEDRARILEDGAAAIRDLVVPGYAELHAFFRDEYVPASRPTLGVTDLPNGRAYYAHRVSMYTTLDVTPREVHQIGLDGVAEIRAAMDAIRDEVGFHGSHLEFVEHLRTDPRFYVDTELEYLAAVALAAKQMEGMLPQLFRELPRTPYGLRAIPAHVAPRHSAGYYDRGDLEAGRGGWININTSQLPSRPLFVARALAYHEGVPGHHLQIMLMRENAALSEFRRASGVTVFTEGWGLYAEKLGLDVDLYDDPYDRFGMWSYQIWRACRLVVDTGMHALGWSRDRAIEYMAENTGMAVDTVTAEIDRHITEPGQGLAYTIGELEITRLREHARDRLGDAFDLREFHATVLGHGALPLTVLAEVVEAWIVETESAES